MCPFGVEAIEDFLYYGLEIEDSRVRLKIILADQGLFLSLAVSGKSRFIGQIKLILPALPVSKIFSLPLERNI
jgi:hypothetical protein